MIDPLLEALALKAVPRAGWIRRGVDAPESVASHSWGVAWLVVVLLPPELDRGRALTYAAIHDLAEVRVGDITPHDGVEPAEKHAREEAAMNGLTARLPAGIREAWASYEAGADAEARFVRELDRLDMALQAVAYRDRLGEGAAEFLRSAARVVRHPALRPLLEACFERLEVPVDER